MLVSHWGCDGDKCLLLLRADMKLPQGAALEQAERKALGGSACCQLNPQQQLWEEEGSFATTLQLWIIDLKKAIDLATC